MAYLVTGGTGFIGSYAVRDLLAAGKDIVCLQRSGVTPLFRQVVGEANVSKIKVIQGDVSDTVLLFDIIRDNKIDVIVHTGAARAPATEDYPALAIRVNCLGTANILEAIRLFGLRRMVWICSGDAFGRVREYFKGPLGDDDAIFAPDNVYGATKVLDEFIARHYFKRYGIDSIGLRVPLTYGFGKNHRPNNFSTRLKMTALNKPVVWEGPDAVKSYLYVEDLSTMIVKACEIATTKTRVFNIVESEWTNKDLVDLLRKINPQSRVTLKESPQGARVVEAGNRAITGAKKELGFKPKYNLESGIRKSFNLWRQEAGMPPL